MQSEGTLKERHSDVLHFFDDVLPRVITLIEKSGEVKPQKQNGNFANREITLDGFCGFCFTLKEGLSPLGGYQLEILSLSEDKREKVILLDVFWPSHPISSRNATAKHLTTGGHWQEILERNLG